MVVLVVMAVLGLIVILPIVLLGGSDQNANRDVNRTGPQSDGPAQNRPSGQPERDVPVVRPRRARGEPIEQVSADLRRLRGRICAGDQQLSAGHQMALRVAYDRVLADACALLEIEHELDRPTAGMERDLERLRVEAELEGHGIVLSRPPSGHTT
jgi:hypothetical protein